MSSSGGRRPGFLNVSSSPPKDADPVVEALTGDLAQKPISYLLSVANHYDATGHLKLGPRNCEVMVQFGLGKPVCAFSPVGKGDEVVLDLFTWDRGVVSFESQKQPDSVNINETLESLIMQGERYKEDTAFLANYLIDDMSILVRGEKLSTEELSRSIHACKVVSPAVLSEIYGNVYGTLNLADVADRLSLRRSQWVMAVAHLLRAGIFLTPDGKSLKITDLEALVFKDNASLLGSYSAAPPANTTAPTGFHSQSPIPAEVPGPAASFPAPAASFPAPASSFPAPSASFPPASAAPAAATPFAGGGAFQGFNTGNFFVNPVIPTDAPSANDFDGQPASSQPVEPQFQNAMPPAPSFPNNSAPQISAPSFSGVAGDAWQHSANDAWQAASGSAFVMTPPAENSSPNQMPTAPNSTAPISTAQAAQAPTSAPSPSMSLPPAPPAPPTSDLNSTPAPQVNQAPIVNRPEELVMSIGLPVSPVVLKLKAGKHSLPLLLNQDTGLLRSDVFEYLLTAEFERACRFNGEFSLIVFCLRRTVEPSAEIALIDLLKVLQRIDELRREVDILGHFGDRTFALLLPSVRADACHGFIERIGNNLAADLAQHRLMMHFGIACAPADATELSNLILAAQMAMKSAFDRNAVL